MTARTVVLLLLVLLTVVAGAVGVVLEPGAAEADAVSWAVVALLATSAVSWTAVGAFLVAKRPGNRLGWLLLAGGLGMNAGMAADRYADQAASDLPHAVYVSALAGWMWVPAVVVLMVIVPLIFPTERPPTPRWRWVGWLAAAAATVMVAEMVTTPLAYPDLFAARAWDAPELARMELVWQVAMLVVILSAVLAWTSLAVRFARSRGEERQQIKWFVFATGLVVAHMVVFGLRPPSWLEVASGVVALPSIAVAVAFAVLRYRLYEIDRVISRTVSYAILTLLLFGIYVGGVLGLGAVARTAGGGGGGDLVVAASTLAVAAAFGPARQRIQAVVDRRFNRARYDAQQAIVEFTQGLRNEVDLDVLGGDLVRVADDALQPSMIGLRLRSEAPS